MENLRETFPGSEAQDFEGMMDRQTLKQKDNHLEEKNNAIENT